MCNCRLRFQNPRLPNGLLLLSDVSAERHHGALPIQYSLVPRSARLEEARASLATRSSTCDGYNDDAEAYKSAI